jgi:hypothetical protein
MKTENGIHRLFTANRKHRFCAANGSKWNMNKAVFCFCLLQTEANENKKHHLIAANGSK